MNADNTRQQGLVWNLRSAAFIGGLILQHDRFAEVLANGIGH